MLWNLRSGRLPQSRYSPTRQARRGLTAANSRGGEHRPSGVLILLSGEPRVYAGDVDYEFRQENNLYYLTFLNQTGSILVLMPGHTRHRELLFLPARNPALETWSGPMHSAEEASQISGVTEIWDAREFEPFLAALRARQTYRPKSQNILKTDSAQPAAQFAQLNGYESLYASANRGEASLSLLLPREELSREFRREQELASRLARTASGYRLRDATPIFATLRERKSPFELRLLQHAVDITIEALGRAMAAANQARWEYELEAEIDYTFKRRHADHAGYPSIVGCGGNATTLHYVDSSGPVRLTDLVLMDVGAEYQHYTADVTRTFPANGKFNSAQSEIYKLVLDAQQASLRVIRPGVMHQEVHRAALDTIKDGLLRLGLITDRNSDQYRLWFMHGTSHFLGMNVHDVGVGGKLEPNMVFTVEPGIYIREDALDYLPDTLENAKLKVAIKPAFEKYKNIGVRIEDD
ncbi:MAG: aminopeptidase P family protein, partial [Pyrinomonadaceae bacterium]